MTYSQLTTFTAFVGVSFLVVSPAQADPIRVGFSTNTLAANDDGSTGAVQLGFSLNYFGSAHDTVFVNNNGNLTFGTGLGTFTPFGLNSTTGIEIIAPFFADVDTRNPASGLVQYGQGTVNGYDTFGATYADVGYFPSSVDKVNSFQVLLIDRSDVGAGDFDIEFNYEGIQWETGSASGGSGGL